MTQSEIFIALNLIRDALIQSHVQMNHAFDQMEKLLERMAADMDAQAKRP